MILICLFLQMVSLLVLYCSQYYISIISKPHAKNLILLETLKLVFCVVKTLIFINIASFIFFMIYFHYSHLLLELFYLQYLRDFKCFLPYLQILLRVSEEWYFLYLTPLSVSNNLVFSSSQMHSTNNFIELTPQIILRKRASGPLRYINLKSHWFNSHKMAVVKLY